LFTITELSLLTVTELEAVTVDPEAIPSPPEVTVTVGATRFPWTRRAPPETIALEAVTLPPGAIASPPEVTFTAGVTMLPRVIRLPPATLTELVEVLVTPAAMTVVPPVTVRVELVLLLVMAAFELLVTLPPPPLF
jgi:hypothetical protein